MLEQSDIDQYLITKELNNTIYSGAALAYIHLVEYPNSNIRQDYRNLIEKNRATLLTIYGETQQIEKAARAWEIKHWFGGVDEQLTEMQKHERMMAPFRKESTIVPKKPVALQKYVRKSKVSGHSAKTEDFEVLLFCSAGRVLITIQDSQVAGKQKFNGASVTLIFDETADFPRGGIQGMSGNKEQILNLLQVSSDNLPEFKPNEKISIF